MISMFHNFLDILLTKQMINHLLIKIVGCSSAHSDFVVALIVYVWAIYQTI